MPKLPDPHLWPLLAQKHDCRQTLSEWDSALGPVGRESIPLSQLKGERATFIRCPQTGIPLEIHENWDGSFSALPPADSQLDSRIDDLPLEDLILYEIDWPALLTLLQQEGSLAGKIRSLDYNPPLWHLGVSKSGSAFFFSILQSLEDAHKILPFLQSAGGATLILPAVADKVFSVLVKEGLRIQILDSSTSLAPPVTAPQKNDSPYRIKQLHTGWKIVFEGKESIFPDMQGMKPLASLLKNPPAQPIHVLDLLASALPCDPVVAQDGSEDHEALGLTVSARLKELNLNLDTTEDRKTIEGMLSLLHERAADEDTTPAARKNASEQIAEIKAFLAAGNLKYRDQPSKAYDRVRNQFNRILKKLRAPDKNTGKPFDVLVAFAEHLDEFLINPSRRFSGTSRSRQKAGVAQTFIYEPPAGTVWTD